MKTESSVPFRVFEVAKHRGYVVRHTASGYAVDMIDLPRTMEAMTYHSTLDAAIARIDRDIAANAVHFDRRGSMVNDKPRYMPIGWESVDGGAKSAEEWDSESIIGR